MLKGELDVQDSVMLAACKAGCRVYRNNVGVLKDQRGIPVRYGLANLSSKQNKLVKSADLIGIMPVVIRPEHVGMTMGVFLSLEIKKEGWRYNPNDPHQKAQAAWVDIVRSLGGYAQMITSWNEVALWSVPSYKGDK